VTSHSPRAICSRACRVCLAIFEMADINEQRTNIKCCVKLRKTFTKNHEIMKNVYGDKCMSRTLCYEWFKRFREGRNSTHDEPRLGRPSMSCDDAHGVQIREIVCPNRCLTVQETAEECNISIGSCHDILTTKLEMHRVVFPTTFDTGSERQSRCQLSGTFGSC
jgi:hypothetical protein